MPIIVLEAPLAEPIAMSKPSIAEGIVAPPEATPATTNPKAKVGD